MSSAELAYGHPLCLPGELLQAPEAILEALLKQLRTSSLSLPTRPSSFTEAADLSSQLTSAEFVYVRRVPISPTLASAFTGPYRVLSRSAKHFTLDLGGRPDTVSMDRLKPHLGILPVTPAHTKAEAGLCLLLQLLVLRPRSWGGPCRG